MSDDGKEGDPPHHVEDPASRYPFISAALEAAREAIRAGASPTDVRAAALAVAVAAPVEVRAAALEVDPEDARLHRWDVNEFKEPWAAMACVALGLNHGFENFMLDNIGQRRVFKVFDSGIDQSTFRLEFMRMREVEMIGLNAHLLLRKSLSQVAEECTKPVFSPVREKGGLQLVEYLIAAGALRGIDVGSTIVAKALSDTTAKANELLNNPYNPNPKYLYDRQFDERRLVNLRDNVWRAIEQVKLADYDSIPPVLSIFDPDLDLSILKGYESWSSAMSRQEYEEWVADDRVLKDRITIQAARDVSKKLDVNDEILAAMAKPRGPQLSMMNKILEDDERHRRFMAERGSPSHPSHLSQIAEGFQRKVRFHDALLAAGRALGEDRFLRLGWKCSVCETQNDPTMTTCLACTNEAPKGAETIPCKALRGLTRYDARELVAHQARLVLERLNILPIAYASAHVAVAAARELEQCSICVQGLDGSSLQVRTPCGHYYHETCINSWLVRDNSCPICRAPLTVAQLTPANERIYQGAKKRKSKRGIKKTRGKKRGRKHRRSRK